MTTRVQQSDIELVQAFIRGDEAAFEELVRRHQTGLYEFVRRQVGEHAEAADICQKVFVRVFLKAASFRAESAFRTWLYQIAANECKSLFRSPIRTKQVDLDDDVLANLPADEVAAGAGDASRLRAAVEGLPPKQRMTLLLRFYGGHTFAEIAAAMDCPAGTAKANYHHAITALRRLLRGTNP
jgi:RNA polymerase sigma-70 factor (ECF subfamily)